MSGLWILSDATPSQALSQAVWKHRSLDCNCDIEIYQHDSQKLVVSDSSSMQFLSGIELDFVKELGAQYFKVNNPNVKANCGCGQSFSV